MSWHEFAARLDGRRQVRRWVLTACGTGAPWWVGPDADTARAVTRCYDWQPIGYPAAVFPMGASVDAGVAEGLRLLEEAKPPGQEWAILGYSQGAVVATRIYQHLKRTASPFLNTLTAAVTWGNPCREYGVAHGNARYGWPMPSGRGIAPAAERLVGTPDWWLDFAHPGDIYTDTPDGPVGSPEHDIGEDMEMIYRVVMDPVAGFGLTAADLPRLISAPPRLAPAVPPARPVLDLGGVLAAVSSSARSPGVSQPLPVKADLGGLIGSLFGAGGGGWPGNPVDAGRNTVIEQLTEMMASPLAEFPAAVGAILNGLTFVANPLGPTYTHVSYDVAPAVDYLAFVGDRVPAAIAP